MCFTFLLQFLLIPVLRFNFCFNVMFLFQSFCTPSFGQLFFILISFFLFSDIPPSLSFSHTHTLPTEISFTLILFCSCTTHNIFKKTSQYMNKCHYFYHSSSIFFNSLHILFLRCSPFSLFSTFDWVINHSVQLGAHSHGLCDLEILAAFFSTWLPLDRVPSHELWP